MKGVATEVKTDIGKNDSEVDPAYVAMVRQRLMAMDPKRLARVEKKYRTMTAGQESQAKSENKTFNKQAGTIQDRTKSVEVLKRKVMSANKKKEIKDADQITKDKANAKAKIDKRKDTKSKVYLDFSAVETASTVTANAIEVLQGEKSLETASNRAKYERNDKDGNPYTDPAGEAELNDKLNALDAKIRTTRLKAEAEKVQLVNRLAFDALRKYQGELTILQVGELFKEEGLGDYFANYVNKEQKLDSMKKKTLDAMNKSMEPKK